MAYALDMNHFLLIRLVVGYSCFSERQEVREFLELNLADWLHRIATTAVLWCQVYLHRIIIHVHVISCGDGV